MVRHVSAMHWNVFIMSPNCLLIAIEGYTTTPSPTTTNTSFPTNPNPTHHHTLAFHSPASAPAAGGLVPEPQRPALRHSPAAAGCCVCGVCNAGWSPGPQLPRPPQSRSDPPQWSRYYWPPEAAEMVESPHSAPL